MYPDMDLELSIHQETADGSFLTEIIQISTFFHFFVSKVYGVPTERYFYHRKCTFICINLFIF